MQVSRQTLQSPGKAKTFAWPPCGHESFHHEDSDAPCFRPNSKLRTESPVTASLKASKEEEEVGPRWTRTCANNHRTQRLEAEIRENAGRRGALPFHRA